MTKKNYTVTGKSDGFGAQYQAIMSGIAYCKFKNYNYIHTPFKKIAHNGNIKSLNNFIGIPNLNSKNNINIDIKRSYSKKVHQSKNPSKYYTSDVINILRNYYYSTSKPVIEPKDIAIHIRRGDAKNMPARHTSNNDYIKIIKFFKEKYPKYNIVIFSEGSIEDFDSLNNTNVSFQLNESIEKTFHELVSAKILVSARSSFSYAAAILNSNEVYYIDFWHKPLDHWKIIYNKIVKSKK